MPEIAECRKYVDQLNNLYQGNFLKDIKIVGGRFLKEGIPGLIQLQHDLPLKLLKFDSKGKFIYAEFETHTFGQASTQNLYMFITLGMAASFGARNKHSAVHFEFDNGEVFYNDIRHFGTIKVVRSKLELFKKLDTLGWDALQDPYVPTSMKDYFWKAKASKGVAELLLDQKIFAGVGNYIRSEVLYRAKINPKRPAASLQDFEIQSVCQNIIDVAKEAYAAGGATIATYSDLYGVAGTYFQNFQVYSKKIDPLGNPVLKYKADDGRAVHWVPAVQI